MGFHKYTEQKKNPRFFPHIFLFLLQGSEIWNIFYWLLSLREHTELFVDEDDGDDDNDDG